MNSWSDMTLGDLAKAFARYRPYVAVAAAIIAIAVFLPGDSDDDDVAGSNATISAGADGDAVGGDLSAGTDADGAAIEGAAAAGGAAASGTATGGARPGATAAGTRVAGGTITLPAKIGPDCDTSLGRIKIPTTYAPPCVSPFSGNNGGSTYQGVTADSILVVRYRPRANPATTAALTAAGAANTPEEAEETHQKYNLYYQNHYETYGRKVILKVKDGSGDSTDDAAARADAIDVAKNMKPFAVYGGGGSNAFVKEIAANKILCICTTSQPQELYEEYDPYVGYTPLMASTQGYIHRAEYIGKRLGTGLAKWARTRDVSQNMATEKRVYGLLYYETPDKAYKGGVDFFEKELAKYGITLKERIEFIYPLQQVQEQAGAMIQKMKSGGVTSVIFSGDPITPAIFTQEASRQRWYPEWVITGSALTDTTLFARTYDQTQWDRASGISFLNARYPEELGDAYKIHMWEFGTPPRADNTYGIIYFEHPFAFYTGVHLAGPNLTPQTWQKGIFSFPITGAGRLTDRSTSWGKHGIWPFTDYTAWDDVTEIWWDPRTTGQDEVGNNAAGMYRYVDGGKRYMPGQHPRAEPRVFDPNGSPTFYNERPAAERSPNYPHQHYK